MALYPQSAGSIEVICGSMFSGKSEELIRRVRRAIIARQKVQVFKPKLDTRHSLDEITSHNGECIKAIVIEDPKEIWEFLQPDTQVVAIDEVQFFSEQIVEVCQDLADKGIRVILAGLDMDYRGKPFGPMPILMAVAEYVDKLNAICMVCGGMASRSQRLVQGKPAPVDGPTILVGAEESYEARCRHCHKLTGDVE